MIYKIIRTYQTVIVSQLSIWAETLILNYPQQLVQDFWFEDVLFLHFRAFLASWLTEQTPTLK